MNLPPQLGYQAMSKGIYAAYAALCYVVFLGTFLYLVGFVLDLGVPKTIDSGAAGSVGGALVVDSLLVLLFGLQHTVMARPRFKAAWVRLIPQPIERSTYVLASNLALILLFWLWRPIPVTLWAVESPAPGAVLTGIALLGFGIAVYSTFLIDHFDLLGLRQVAGHLRGQTPSGKGFRTPSLYRLVRHPLYLGFLIAFWLTPHMTVGHFLFSALNTAYIFIGIPFEERDLARALGDDYIRYREKVPMVLPLPRRG